MMEVLFKDGRKVQVDADFMLCPASGVELYKRRNGTTARVRSYPSEEVKDVNPIKTTPVRELAIKLLGATSKTPHGSRRLAQLAGVEYTDLVIPILKKLREAGKVVFVEGRWARA